MNRRTLLKSAVALLAAPFARFARAEVPTVAITAPLYRKGIIEAVLPVDPWSIPNFAYREAMLAARNTVNAVPMTLTIGDASNKVTFKPGTLKFVHWSVDKEPTDGVRRNYATYQYHTAGFNNSLVPGQGYREDTPAMYPASDFAGFRETHEGLVWTLVQK